jgi:hypothetical protein
LIADLAGEDEPEQIDSLSGIAHLALEVGDPAAALEALGRARELALASTLMEDTQHERLGLRLAEVHRGLGHWAEAKLLAEGAVVSFAAACAGG